jgi:hypothetical protein
LEGTPSIFTLAPTLRIKFVTAACATEAKSASVAKLGDATGGDITVAIGVDWMGSNLLTAITEGGDTTGREATPVPPTETLTGAGLVATGGADEAMKDSGLGVFALPF